MAEDSPIIVNLIVFIGLLYALSRATKWFMNVKRKRDDVKLAQKGAVRDPRILPFDDGGIVVPMISPVVGLWVLILRKKYERHAAVGDFETANECARKVAKVKTWWFVPLVTMMIFAVLFGLVAILLLITTAFQ